MSNQFESYLKEETRRDVVVSAVKDEADGHCIYSHTITHRHIRGKEYWHVSYNKKPSEKDKLYYSLEGAVEAILDTVLKRWTPKVHGYHYLIMLSTTAEERAIITDTWTRWQNSRKESENEQ